MRRREREIISKNDERKCEGNYCPRLDNHGLIYLFTFR